MGTGKPRKRKKPRPWFKELKFWRAPNERASNYSIFNKKNEAQTFEYKDSLADKEAERKKAREHVAKPRRDLPHSGGQFVIGHLRSGRALIHRDGVVYALLPHRDSPRAMLHELLRLFRHDLRPGIPPEARRTWEFFNPHEYRFSMRRYRQIRARKKATRWEHKRRVRRMIAAYMKNEIDLDLGF